MSTPSQNAIPKPLAGNPHGQAIYGLLSQLDQSQWWESAQLAQAQTQQLAKLVAHAQAHSPFYKSHLRGIDSGSLSLDSLRDIPLLTRKLLQDNNDSIDCNPLPQGHDSVKETMTSGSTGSPVKLRCTALSATVWNALNMREQLWHGRDFSKVSASIRWRGDGVGMPPDGVEFEDWGLPANLFRQTGPGHFLNSSVAITDQIAWLQRVQPDYLMTHPSNLRALISQLRRSGSTLQGLSELRTVGENLDADLRVDAAELLGARIVDLYSSEELGYIALQCPQQNHYHVQSESVLLEVLRDDGSACGNDEPGKIVVTSLRNYATPLIRYEIGDYGELGGPCSCGRGLPVLKTIRGRTRNMLQHPDGSLHWPNFGFRKMMPIAPLRQFQLLQHSLEEIEFRLVVDERLSAEQEAGIREILWESLGYPFKVRISYHSQLERSANGKFEDFVSLLR